MSTTAIASADNSEYKNVSNAIRAVIDKPLVVKTPVKNTSVAIDEKLQHDVDNDFKRFLDS